MKKKHTKAPLHEVVLRIMFHQNKKKAEYMSVNDILWKIDNPDIAERQIKEVLDWLVHHRKVEVYLGKYCLDRVEFLEQKKFYEDNIDLDSNVDVDLDVESPNFYIEDSRKPRNNKRILFWIFIGIYIVGIFFSFNSLNSFSGLYSRKENDTILKNEIKTKIPSLYISSDTVYSVKSVKDIRRAFYRQNKTNEKFQSQIDNFQVQVDSVLNKYNKLLLLQEQKIELLEQKEEKQKSFFLGFQIFICLLLIIAFFK
ncbi:DUF5457 domain-containing protein [Aureivirga marina]|uniref:DUF5457 domain-containing protein n=1 Tax=Aureivirga marina TaxID=1182451 RepID=UPI0018CAD7AE|nr:DUF5457 domain-containing protein [Aureivirga marina]